MVTLRSRGLGNAARSSGQRQRRGPGRSAASRPRDPRGTRNRGLASGTLELRVSNGFHPEDIKNHTDSETHRNAGGKPTRARIRKSVRLLTAGGRRSGPRRSNRPTKPTSRYQACTMFSDIHVKSVMKGMHAMKNRSWPRNSKGIFSKARGRRTPDDSADENDNVSRQEGTAGGCVDQSFDAKVSRASALYPGPSSEFARDTFRIGTSGPTTTRGGALRPTRSPWANGSDGDDSDEEVQTNGGVSGSLRPFGLRADLLGVCREKMSGAAHLADIDPMTIDRSVGFDSIGGLACHISALKEMVVFPLLYPEVFDNFKIQPPRGCLFYGPPGTGKTLVARALANECSHGNRRVAFFMRKGADCLSKWVGESERQLRLLFEQAYQMRPSIIFFDEIDGLAPVRSSRQDQIHSSIVSTLLALMDGLDSRGEVVVIGATNRLDSIDPALRRPGRFDREFLFGLPDRESRKEILKIHTRQWKPPPSEDFLDELSERCVGYCGADIRAVCTEAALCALRRRFPQIYRTSQKLLLDLSSISVGACDFAAAMKKMSPASLRSAASPARPLSAVIQPLLGRALRDTRGALCRLFPHSEHGARRKKEPDLTSGVLDDGLAYGGSSASPTSASSTSKTKHLLHFARSAVKNPTSHRPRLLLAGRPDSGQTSHLAPAILHSLERFSVHSLDSAVLFGGSSAPEEACAQVFCEARRTSPSILYVPHIQQWWDTAGPALRASFLSLLDGIPSFSPILLLATCSVPLERLDAEIQSLFREEYGEFYIVRAPTRQERMEFFQDLLLNQATEAPPLDNTASTEPSEVLPLAPPPPPRQLSQEERLRLAEREEDVLRELRLFLRNVTERLSLDRRFKHFTAPFDPEEDLDYPALIRKPMDLSTLLTNIDEHKYVTIGEFLSDVDLIWRNVLSYHTQRDPDDRHMRHCAYALKDMVRAIIRDELDKDFERVCERIKESRMKRASSCGTDSIPEEFDNVYKSIFSRNGPQSTPVKKKRYRPCRKSKWSTGVIKKPKKKKEQTSSSSSSSSSSSTASSRGGSERGPEESRFVLRKALNGFADRSSSALSESSDGEHGPSAAAAGNARHPGFTAAQNGGVLNGFHHRRLPRVPARTFDFRHQTRTTKTRTPTANGAHLHKLEGSKRLEVRVIRGKTAEILEKGPSSLVVDHHKLRAVLNRAVVKTDGMEVEPLEKLYAMLAQCIYRHRHNLDKTQLIQEMNKEIDHFS